jgi:hypothetical protein
MENILNKIRKEAGIQENIPKKFLNLVKGKKTKNVSSFVTVNSSGDIIEISAKPGPFVLGERLFRTN